MVTLQRGGEMMNLTTIRSGNLVVMNVECILGFSFKTAIARENSTLFQVIAVLGSSFISRVIPV